ncbi:MAG: hypothetical protein EBY38_08385 [Flavobacteriaceae bacterium]|nr:hypothetical protein [Flavobacteriaceae bacterium]
MELSTTFFRFFEKTYPQLIHTRGGADFTTKPEACQELFADLHKLIQTEQSSQHPPPMGDPHARHRK